MLRRNCRLYLHCIEDVPPDTVMRYILLKNERIAHCKDLLKNYTRLLQTDALSVWSRKERFENPAPIK